MVVQLTTTSKRENSTAIPSMSYSTQCRLKAPSSVMTPVLMFDRENLDHEYNYIYIPDFNRYYWVMDVVYAGALIEYRCRIDVLASYKTAIGNSTQYVLRSASRYNGYIMDNMYPVTSEVQFDSTIIQSPYSTDTTKNAGVFSVGIAGASQTMYYLFSSNALTSFLDYILSDLYCADVLGILALTTNPQLKLAVDPLQYVTSIIWLPFLPDSTTYTQVQSVKVGFVDVDCTAYKITQNVQTIRFNFSSLPDHPLASTRGAYLNVSPFTLADLFIPPFGKVQVDTTKLLGASSMDVINNVDLRTGTSTLNVISYIQTGEISKANVLSTLSGNIGIPMQLSQVRAAGIGISNIIGAASSIVSGMEGGALGIIAGGVQAIGDVAKSMIPTTSTVGSSGGFDALSGNIMLLYAYYIPVDDDNTQHGRPLCELVQINTLSGYILCAAGAEIQITGTADEEAQIRSYMEGGFFYE